VWGAGITLFEKIAARGSRLILFAETGAPKFGHDTRVLALFVKLVEWVQPVTGLLDQIDLSSMHLFNH